MKTTCGLVMVTLVGVLLSCSGPLMVAVEPAASATGMVAVQVGGASENVSRTVVPDLTAAVDTYEVVLSSDDGYTAKAGTVTAPQTSITFEDVETGVWDIGVTAKKGGAVVGTGAVSNQTVAVGQTLTLVIPISFSQAGGTGGLSLAISFPASTGIDYVRGDIAGSVLTSELTDVGSNRTATLVKTGLESGIHVLVLTFKRGGASGVVAGVFRESVNVWNNVTSNKWIDSSGSLVEVRAFSASEFFDANANLQNLVLSEGTIAFSSGTTSYDAGHVLGASITITPAASVSGQYLQYRMNGGSWIEIGSSEVSGQIALSEGANTLEVKVTAADRQTEKTYTVAIQKAHTVSYNDNGATGGSVPTDSNSYVQDDPVMVLGNTGNLVRTGNSFSGWNIQADGSGTTYGAGESFTMGSANVTLYAKWNQRFSVIYDSNASTGGSAPVDSNGYEEGQTVTVLDNTGSLVRAGQSFFGWNTLPGGSGTRYLPAQTLVMGSVDLTLYAAWAATSNVLALDGVDDYVTASDCPSFDLGVADDFTVELYFYVPDRTNDTVDYLVLKSGSYDLYVIYHASAPDRVVFLLDTFPPNYVGIVYDIELAVGWHHVAVVFDNEYAPPYDLMAIYVDGALGSHSQSTGWSPGIPNSTTPLCVGGATTSSPAVGFIDEVRFSKTVRYSGPTYSLPVIPFVIDSDTLALWHFDESPGSAAFGDSSGDPHALTGHNGARSAAPP